MRVFGIDGCRAGWIAIEITFPDQFNCHILPSLQESWPKICNVDLILIDIPIGLRDNGSISRLCDIAARDCLGRGRSSSIFPPPCREVLKVLTYLEANLINRQNTGKGLSKQAWNITHKIRDVDRLLQSNIQSRAQIFESHPEICFWGLAGKQAMKHYKKTEAGYHERLTIIRHFYPKLADFLSDYRQKNIVVKNKPYNQDDIIDAGVLALTAFRGHKYLRSLPEKPEIDSTGLPMRITFSLY